MASAGCARSIGASAISRSGSTPPSVVDPAQREETDQIFFGATVTYAARDGTERTVSIVGVDEADAQRGRVSWISPIAKALLRKRAGDCVSFATPSGLEEIEIVDVCYEPVG